MLEKSIDEFTSALIDPLKADPDTRKTFQSCFDYVIDKAIDTEQKKVLHQWWKKFLVNLLYSIPIEDSGGKSAAHLDNLTKWRNIMPFR